MKRKPTARPPASTPMPPLPSTSLNSAPLSPPSPAAPTHRVLSLYYPHLHTLASLFPPSLIKEKDPNSFKQFLEECLVCTNDSTPVGPYKVLEKEDESFGMGEILNQVLSIIFKRHSTAYHLARKHGLPAFSTPKNVLAAGHRLNLIGGNNHSSSGMGMRIGTGPLFEPVYTNTVFASINSSKCWSLLLSRVGPDSIIKLLSSPTIALFQPLKNDCYLQISGTPTVELKVIEKPQGSGKKGKGEGRKTHVRTVKKRGKKKKKGTAATEEYEELDEHTDEENVGETQKMDLDSPAPTLALADSTQADVSLRPTKKARILGPSNSAPSLLSLPSTATNEKDLPRIATQVDRVQAQTQTQTRIHRSVSSMNLGPAATQGGFPSSTQAKVSTVLRAGGLDKKKMEKMISIPHNSIVFSRHRIYHARVSKLKGGKIAYGLSPKHILSQLSESFVLPTTVYPPTTSSPATSTTTQTTNHSTSHFFSAARHLSKYVFPSQFNLDNVFKRPESTVSGGKGINLWLSVRPDHEDRVVEIKKLGTIPTPKRLRSKVVPLLNKLIVLNQRCNYRKLLELKCPSKDLMSEPPLTQLSRPNATPSFAAPLSSSTATARTNSQQTSISASSNRIPDSQPSEQATNEGHQEEVVAEEEEEDSLRPIKPKSGLEKKPKLAEFACSPYEVESYVQAVVRDVIPRSFWGSERNRKLVFKQISQFLRMRRFESISLHSLLQGFSILDCEWLDPSSSLSLTSHNDPNATKRNVEDSQSRVVNPVEMEKRKELLAEFLYWLFDSFITDLVRTAFYVTDSATHQNRPLYFRQDDWKALTAPLLESLGQTVFERIPDNQVIALERQPRELGFSYVRLLPKEAGVRPIVNLARRPIRIGMNGEKEVGQPINLILRSVFDVLTFESKRKPDLVGSLVSNPQEIYAKLKGYKTRLLESDETVSGDLPELYFVKVDVKSCFDTIKQDKLLALVEDILSETLYYIQKYSQVVAYSGKTARMFKRQACGDDDLGSFRELAMRLAEDLHNVVLTDQVRYDDVGRDRLMALLKEHITTNLVKVNGHLYRQKDGIPQGSVLSSLLCSLFYGDMEKHCLAFTKDVRSLLMRYVDDFMFVTTKKHLAVRFLQTMHNGIPEYGCFVSTEKRLTNFDVSLDDGEIVPPLPLGQDFSYCGLAIDTKTLEIKMNLQLQMNKEIVNQLTVQRYRKPGEAFINAMLRAVKVRAHSMYTDTNFNSTTTVYENIYQAMLVVALKYRAYVQEWCGSLKGKTVFFWNVIQKVVKYEHSALFRQGTSRKAAKLDAAFNLERTHVIWLGYHAFHRVLSRRPAAFSPLIRLLLAEIKTPLVRGHLPTLKKIVKDEKNGFVDQGKAG
ncbi:telomerase reverse transcriptase [Sporobolomyces salmoneus]|uniref:telomerase reverse transcriptase n=1 Tax=Sporobolomyces salmoneus TaxID=183962 RepID=UPI00316BF247